MRLPEMRRRFAMQEGFTLVELLGVAVILIILSLLAMPVYAEVTDKARVAKTQEQLRVIEQALEAYRADATIGGRYPASLDELRSSGFLKIPSYETPWGSGKEKIYYYYAVDSTATKYVIGDPGTRVGASSRNGNEHGTAEVLADLHQYSFFASRFSH